MSKKLIPSLNGLRALSIIFVLAGHTELRSFHITDDPPGMQVGVTIFFLISGFLITWLLMQEERQNNGRISLKGFYIRRAFRIFPVYYTLLLVYFFLQLAGIFQFTTASWVSSLTYTKYLSPRWGEWESGHLWSLSVEEHFYLVWPTVFYFFKRFRVPFALAVMAVVPFVRLWGHFGDLHMFTRADALMAGCLLALYYERLTGVLLTLPRVWLLLPFAVMPLSLSAKRLVKLFFPGDIPLAKMAVAFSASYGILTLLCLGLILAISINFTNNPWFRFLNNPVMNYIGKLSYSLYIWQQMFFSDKLWPASRFPYNIAFIVITALLSYHLVETPFLRIKDRLRVRTRAVRIRTRAAQVRKTRIGQPVAA